MRTIFLCLLLCKATVANAGVIFSDSFENGISNFWTEQVSGDPQPPAGQNAQFYLIHSIIHTGQWAATTNTYGMALMHDFGSPQVNVTFEAWIYDTGDPNQETLLVVADHPNYGSGGSLYVGIEGPLSPTKFSVNLGIHQLATAVNRTTGWHLIQIYNDGLKNYVYFDNQFVINYDQPRPFTNVWLWTNNIYKPSAENFSAGLWDDVVLYNGSPITGGYSVPEPSSILLFGVGISCLLFLYKYFR